MTNRIEGNIAAALAAEARRGRITRRRFMEGALAAGLLVPAAEGLWSSEVLAQTPKRGGTFRAGIHDGSTNDTLDPALAVSFYTVQINMALRSFLTEIGPNNEIAPDSAESWEASDGAKLWRFKLAKGQEFHNGKPLTAKDVVATLNYHRSEQSKSAAKPLLAEVEEVSADGDDVVVIKLSSGNADMPFIMSDYHLAILPADGEGKVDATSGIGSGPYKLADFQPGVILNATRNDKYHRADQAFFDSIRLVNITDAGARQQALVSGDIDAVSDVDLKTIDLFAQNPDIRIDETPGGTYNGMPMNCRIGPYDNADFRNAMKYLMNRQEIIDKVMLGHATMGNDQPVSPIMPYYSGDVPQRGYDLDKAKFHMKKSGLGNLKISLSAGDAAFAGSVDMGLLIREDAAKVGIDMDVVREPPDGYWSNVWQKKPFVVVANGQRPTPDMIFTIFFKDGAPWNDTNWSDPKFQSLLVAAKSEADQKKRAEMYHDMQSLCSADGGTLIPFFRNKIYARRANVAHGPSISSAWELDGGKAYQRWWFES